MTRHTYFYINLNKSCRVGDKLSTRLVKLITWLLKTKKNRCDRILFKMYPFLLLQIINLVV